MEESSIWIPNTDQRLIFQKEKVTCSKKWRKHSYVAIFSAASNRESCSSSVKVEAHLVIKYLCQGSEVKGLLNVETYVNAASFNYDDLNNPSSYSWFST